MLSSRQPCFERANALCHPLVTDALRAPCVPCDQATCHLLTSFMERVRSLTQLNISLIFFKLVCTYTDIIICKTVTKVSRPD